MEKIKKYQSVILEMLKAYERSSDSIETCIVSDTKNHHYQVMESGWQDKNTYYFNTPIHLHIKPDGKIWILENKTEDDIALSLVEQGVDKLDIVLNFIPERVRQYSGFATA